MTMDPATVVADAGTDLLPIVSDIASRVPSSETACWVIAAAIVAFAFAYMAMRWF